MSFLYSGFLFALLAVAIPILIHLFNFRKYKKVLFSNISFLQEIKSQNSSREKLKNLLILFSRILAISLLVLAFARPFLANKPDKAVFLNNQVSIYIDNSYSMSALGEEGSLLDEAKRSAKEIIKNYQPNDRFQLLTNDFEGKQQRFLNSDEFLKALDEVRVSSAHRVLQQVIHRQESVFFGSYNKSSYLLSDFQQNFVGKQKVEHNEDISLTLLKLTANELPNLAIDSLWFTSPVHRASETEALVYRIRNYGKHDAKNIPLRLTINQQQKGLNSVSVKANSVLIDTLNYSNQQKGWQKGELRLKDYPLTFDDVMSFSYKINEHQKVLAIQAQNAPNYLEALFKADSYFDFIVQSENSIDYKQFENYPIVILNGLTQPSSGLAQELNKFLNKGGSLVIFPSTEADKNLYSSFLNALHLPSINSLINEKVKVSSLELKNTIFKDVFEELPQNLELPLVNHYFEFNENQKTIKDNLLQLPLNRFLLANYPVLQGKVYLASTSLDEKDSNLAKHPIFLPLMYKIAFESNRDLPLYYFISGNNLVQMPSTSMTKNQSLKVFGNGFEIIPEYIQSSGQFNLFLSDQVKQSGFYTVKNVDEELAVLAFNDNREESDLTYATESDLIKKLGDKNVYFADANEQSINSLSVQKNKGVELWKLCLILSLIFILTEILLIRFFNTSKNIKKHEPSHQRN